jgi:hypothetical protein
MKNVCVMQLINKNSNDKGNQYKIEQKTNGEKKEFWINGKVVVSI